GRQPPSAADTSRRRSSGTTTRLWGWRELIAPISRAGSMPAKLIPTAAIGNAVQEAPEMSGAYMPATFASSVDSGIRHRWRRIASGAVTVASDSATHSRASALRQTPLGAEVLPDVYVTFTVPGGRGGACAGSETGRRSSVNSVRAETPVSSR